MNLIVHRPGLIRVAYKYTHNSSLAEDFADQAIGQGYVNLRKWRGGNMAAWLRSILINICRHWTRDTKTHEAAAPAVLKKGERSPLQNAITNEILKGVEEALDALTEKQRECIKLSQLDGLDYVEVGIRVGIRPGAARALVFRARAMLTKKLERFIA